MVECVLLTSAWQCVLAVLCDAKAKGQGIPHNVETIHEGVDVYNAHSTMINLDYDMIPTILVNNY